MKEFFVSCFCMLMYVSATAQEIKVAGHTIMSPADFGFTTEKGSWNAISDVVSVSKPRKVIEDYRMLVGKRSRCHNEGSERVYTMVNVQNDTLLLVMRQFKDGYAFRYVLPDSFRGYAQLSESTKFHIPASANRWMQQYDGSGYEHFYPLCPGGVSPEGTKITEWGQPALFEVRPGKFVLLTETDVMDGHCGCIFTNTVEDRNTYGIKWFDEQERFLSGGGTPWRIVIAGSLSDVVESTLVTDLATPSSLTPHPTQQDWIETGVSSWIYWAHNHGSQDYNILKEYVDLAADMKWPYTLVDAEWDVMRNGTIEELCKYAVAKGVKPMIWYNSTTNWTGKWAPTPQGRLNDADECDREFSKIASWGVKGVKIDFFREDNSETINYYLRLLRCAAAHHLLVNFHGGTIPRGWQRTYPNLISCESVYGAEWYNNNGILTNKAACHNATLPFTRNVIGSMDYTPGTFTDSQHPHITTHAHELALSFLFESGIQHMPDRPETYRGLPEQIRTLLKELPTTWDDTKLLSGYPGQSVVMARRKGCNWYIAGVNGTDEERTLRFNLDRLGRTGKSVLLVSDGESQTSFKIEEKNKGKGEFAVDCKPRGGFVMKIKN